MIEKKGYTSELRVGDFLFCIGQRVHKVNARQESPCVG